MRDDLPATLFPSFVFCLLPFYFCLNCYNPPHSPFDRRAPFLRTACALRVIKRGTMDDLKARPRNRQATFALALCAALALASALPLTTASCRTQAPRADEPAAFERLRTLTRGGTLPAEAVVAQLATDFAGTRTG